MSTECNCGNSLANLGVLACDKTFGVTDGIIIVPITANDGTKNKIAAADVLNQAYFEGKVNNVDPSKRWYGLWNIDNVEDVRADADMFDTEKGRSIYIQDGIRSFMAKIFKASVRLLKALQSARCTEFGIYRVDTFGNIIGTYDGTDLYPTRVDNATFQALLTLAKTKEPQDVTIKFQFDRLESDSDLLILTKEEMSGVILKDIPSLLDVTAVVSAETGTGFTVTLTLDKGSFKTTIPAVGFVLADFTISGVTITSVTESSAGVYNVVTPVTTGVKTLTIKKNGYEVPSISVDFGA